MTDFVVLSTADWDHPLWTNKQHVACSLSEIGHRVLYVDSLGVRGPRGDRSDAGRILRRLKRGLRGPRQVRPNLWVISPLVLPGQSSGVLGRLNRWSLGLSLFVADLILDLRNPLLWTFNPQTCHYLSLNKFHASIYHCVDRIQAQPGMPADAIERAEKDLCGSANAVFTTAPQLQQTLAELNAGTHYFGNVADAKFFSRALDSVVSVPDDLPQGSEPILMFVGAIDAYKLDLPMLEALVARHPEWNVVLIGPVGETDPSTDVSGLKRFSNVYFLGPKPYAVLPNYLAQADVALLPLQLNDYTRHMYPMKFFEYLAAGRVVVATAIPSLQDQADVALLCRDNVEAFSTAIRRALNGDSPALEMRLERAQQHTYFVRTQRMLATLQRHGLLPAEPSPPQAPPYHHVRSQLKWSWLKAQVWLSLVWLLDRFRATSLSKRFLMTILRNHPRNLALLSGMTQRCLQEGDYAQACSLIERIWVEDGNAQILHHLLFRRGSRPGSRVDQLAMFDALAESCVLPARYVGYCRVVRTYRAIDAKDEQALRLGVSGLSEIVNELEHDPNTYLCLRPNRENRAKLLISAQLTRFRALMALEDCSGLERAALDLIASVGRYDPFAIDCETAVRMTRNMLRSLTIAAVMAWHAADPLRYRRVVAEVERLRDACYHKRFEAIVHFTQEDHRAFADELLSLLELASWPVDAPEQHPGLEQLVDPMLLVYFPDLRLHRAEKARCFLQSLGPVAGG